MINCLTKSAIKLPNATGLVSKTSTNQTNKVLRKRLKMFIRKCVVLMNQLKRLILIDNTKVIEITNKICSITGLVTTTAINVKVIEIENRIPNITNLATKAARKNLILVIFLILKNSTG